MAEHLAACPRCKRWIRQGKEMREHESHCRCSEPQETTTNERNRTLRGLIDRAICNLRHYRTHDLEGEPGYEGAPIWSAVAYVFGVGSTTAHEMCREAGVNPAVQVNATSETMPPIPRDDGYDTLQPGGEFGP